MKRETISTANAPAAIGPYSQGVRIGNILYTSGQIPINPESGDIPEGVKEQTLQVMDNLKAVIEEAGGSMKDIVKTTIFIQNMDDFAAINEAYASRLTEPYPARSTVEVVRLPKDVLLEIEAVVMME